MFSALSNLQIHSVYKAKHGVVIVFLLLSLCLSFIPMSGRAGELKSLSSSDGLSDLLVNTIFKDSTGYVWFGTEVALDRFDGNRVKSYMFPSVQQGSLRVNAITELRRGEIFVGNHQGLFVLAPGAGELSRLFSDKITFPVNALADDGQENLYIGTRQGVFHYNVVKNNLSQILLRPDVLSPENEVTSLLLEPVDGMWILTNRTLYFRYDDGSQTESIPLPGAASAIGLIKVEDVLYIATNGDGVLRYDTAERHFLQPVELGNNIITSLCGDSDGGLYIATDGEGVFRYSGDSAEVTDHLTSSPSSTLQLKSNSVYSMMADDKGLLWIGYYQTGVEFTPYYNRIFDVYSWPGFIDTRDFAVRAVAVDGRRKVIGTREGLYYIDEATGRTAKFVKPDIKSNIIFCIARYGGRYYIGTYNGGMYELNPSTLAIRPVDTRQGDLATASVFAIEADREGSVWVGSSKGLFRFKDGHLTGHFTSVNSRLPEGNVYEIFFDSSGRGWFCTETGLAIWNGSTIQTDRFPKGFVNDMKIRDIYEDRSHTLYFAPDRGEVFRSNLELTEFGFIRKPSGSSQSMTTFIIEDPDGWLWLGTDRGLVRYNKHDHFHLFNNAYGIPNLVFTLCPPVRDNSGNLWMGNSSGLLKLTFSRFKEHSDALWLEPYVTDVATNGQSIMSRMTRDHYGRHIELGENETDLSVSFSNFSYFPSQYSTLEYMLDGFNDDWQSTDGTKPIHFYDLPQGDYMLRMRLPGNPSTETILRVHRSDGLNWPVLTVILIVFLTLGFGAYLMYNRRRHREELSWIEAQAALSARSSDADRTEMQQSKAARYKTTRLSDEECKRLLKVLDGVMREQKPYTNPDLKSADLAAMAGTTGHALSFLFNQFMNKSYYDYVNSYRVEEFKRMVHDKDISKYTLTALSQMCGFSSRASFFRHFKSITGITPAEYLKQQ